jgi:hypothetical protein
MKILYNIVCPSDLPACLICLVAYVAIQSVVGAQEERHLGLLQRASPAEQSYRACKLLDGEMETQRENMHCQGIACTRLFNMVLTSAKGQMLECFK